MHLVVIGLVCVFLEVSLTALYFRLTYCPPPSELVLGSCKCHMFLSALGKDLGTYGTCMSGVQALDYGAVTCHVECITASFLAFFQFGENNQ